MAEQNIVVIGASAGSLEALRALVAELPADLQAPVFVVCHMGRDYPDQLAHILAKSTPLPVIPAVDGERIQPGYIYVARPDYHLIVDKEQVRVTRGPTENGMRPSIDVLFRSAALAQGGRVVSVILSGSLDDGVSGVFAVKERGGVTIVQDPLEALYADLPLNVIEALKIDFVLGEVDYVLPIAKMGEVLKALSEESADEAPVEEAPLEHAPTDAPPEEGKGVDMLSRMETEVAIARGAYALENGILGLGVPSLFSCPECHGILLQLKEGTRTRFRCHTGHAFSANTLLSEITRQIEDQLWSATRAMEESQMLLEHLGEHLRQGGDPEVGKQFLQQAQKIKERSLLVRQAALDSEALTEEKIRREFPLQDPPQNFA